MPTIQDIDNQISSLEAKQARPIREFNLNPQDIVAFMKIKEIDTQVCDLRCQRNDLVAEAAAQAIIDAQNATPLTDTCN